MRRNRWQQFVGVVVGSISVASAQPAGTVTNLAATIRDFDPSHPAFEHFTGGGAQEMVLSTLGSDGTPVANPAVDAFGNASIYDWFHDIPGVNYSVCRDIPLTQSKAGLFSYENAYYFPIDDLDPKVDPHNKQFRADDGELHNFHFCLESHAQFVYQKGQKFDFTGDDDVWVFINNKLAVDLGGVHSAQDASVNLDKLGLVVGQTYPFDFFFCERRTQQSHMKITTSLDLKNVTGFDVRQTSPSTGVRVFDPYVQSGTGQGCAARTAETPVAGRYVITGGGLKTPAVLPAGTSYGGLTVRTDGTEIKLDSLSMRGLPAGTYVLRVQQASDTTKFRDYTFVVAQTTPLVPSFPKYTDNGDRLAKVAVVFTLDVAQYSAQGAQATTSLPFRLTPVAGLSVYSDSLLQKKVSFYDTLSTGPNGEPRRLWVRGDAVGAYTLVLRTQKGDSSDVVSVSIKDHGIRWVDSLGRTVQPSAITVDVGRPIHLWLQSYQGKGICDTCDDVVSLDASALGVSVTNLAGKPIANLTLAKGQGSFLLTSDVAVSNVSVVATLASENQALPWKPLAWKGYHLAWTDSSGTLLANPASLLGDVSSTVTAWVGVWGVGGLCTSCNLDLDFGPTDSVYLPVDSKGRAIASIKIVSGKAKIVLSLEAAGISKLVLSGPQTDSVSRTVEARRYRLVWTDSLGRSLSTVPNLLGDVTGTVSGWVRVEGVAGLCKTCNFDLAYGPYDSIYEPIDSKGNPAWGIKLAGGQGRIDLSLLAPGFSKLSLSSEFADSTVRTVEAHRLHLVWTDSLGRTLTNPAQLAGNVTTKVSAWLRVLGTRGVCTTCDFELGFDPTDTVFQPIDAKGNSLPAIELKAGAARIDLALVGPGTSKFVLTSVQTDSLSRSVLSEPFQLVFLDTLGKVPTANYLKGEIFQVRELKVQVKGRSGLCDTCSGTIVFSPTDGLVVTDSTGNPLAGLDVVHGVAALWFHAEKEVDSGKIVGELPDLWAKGTVSPIRMIALPPDSAAWYDENGDGKADHLHVWLHHPWTAETRIRAAWPDTSKWVGPDLPDLEVSLDGMELDLHLQNGLEGTSSVTTDLGRWSRDGGPWKKFAIQDRIAAVPLKAILHRGTTWDTLRVYPSEPVKDIRDPDDAIRKLADDGTLPIYAFSRRFKEASSGALVFVFPATSDSAVPEPGDYLRFTAGGKVLDLFGNKVPDESKAVQILGTDRAPQRATIYDVNGDGKADRVVLKFAKPLIAHEDWRFLWPASGAGYDVRVRKTTDATTDSTGTELTFELPPFAFASTSCPADDCRNLGALVAVLGTDSVITSFPVKDGVEPVPVKASLRYTGNDGEPDTLVAVFSEPVTAPTSTFSWISWGDMVPGDSGIRLAPSKAWLSDDRLTATFLVDTMVQPRPGQGIRINTLPRGGLKDASGNAPADTAVWAKIELGPIPPRVGLKPYHPFVEATGKQIPPNEPPLQIFVRGGRDGHHPWTTVDGAPVPDTTRLAGVMLDLNGSTELSAYLYDNIGVFMAHDDFAAVKTAYDAGRIPVDSRGNYQVWITWNGSKASVMSGSGIYLLRVVGWRSIGARRVVQQNVFKLGWARRDIQENWYP